MRFYEARLALLSYFSYSLNIAFCNPFKCLNYLFFEVYFNFLFLSIISSRPEMVWIFSFFFTLHVFSFVGSSRSRENSINLLTVRKVKMFSSRKQATQKSVPQTSSFAADTFLLRRGSEATRYKVAALLMFVAGFGLLTLGTWVLNDFNFLTFTNWWIFIIFLTNYIYQTLNIQVISFVI